MTVVNLCEFAIHQAPGAVFKAAARRWVVVAGRPRSAFGGGNRVYLGEVLFVLMKGARIRVDSLSS